MRRFQKDIIDRLKFDKMKKLVAFAAVIAAVSFASCNNKTAEPVEVAETEVSEQVEEVAPAANDTTAAPAAIDSTATGAVEAVPAE